MAELRALVAVKRVIDFAVKERDYAPKRPLRWVKTGYNLGMNASIPTPTPTAE